MTGPRWFLVQTHSNAERVARDALSAPYRACSVYLPLELVTVVHARRKREVERAFFARYLFVRDAGQGVPVIRTAPGVTHLARRGVDPIMVPQNVIDEIKSREVAGYVRPDDYELLTPRKPRFRSGQSVRVTDSPFASFGGVFSKRVNNEQRALIAVDIFGRTTPVELGYDQFEAA